MFRLWSDNTEVIWVINVDRASQDVMTLPEVQSV